MSERESLECGACPGTERWLAQYANECFNISRISLAILYNISRPSVGYVTHTAEMSPMRRESAPYQTYLSFTASLSVLSPIICSLFSLFITRSNNVY